MPSKPAVTRKCQCFKIKPQLLSCQPPWRAFARARVEREGLREPRRAHSKLVLCTPLKARWVAHGTRQQPRRGLTLSLVPFRLNTRTTSATSHCTASSPSGQSLETELQHVRLRSVGQKTPQKKKKKLNAAFEKRHNEL